MLNRGSILSAPLTNLSDYKILLDNAGDSLKDLFVSYSILNLRRKNDGLF